MIQKHYSDDWAKSRSRDLVRGMIEDTVLQYRKPSQVTVLCFPGVDTTEIEEVYDPLGIPRENIIGLERDPEIAKLPPSKNFVFASVTIASIVS